MYLEHAKLNPFDVLYNIQYYDPIPIPVRKKIEDTEKLWTSERKKEAVKIVPQGISYMKRNTLTPDELAAGLKEMMSRLKREEKSKRKGKGNRNEKIKVRANPFEQAFASQFYLGEDGFASLSWDRSTQIQGDFRGGLISIAQVQWEYGARDVSQSTEQLMYNNKRSKRDYSSSTIGVNKDAHICVIKEVDTSSASLFEGAVNATVGNLGQVCNNAVAFNVIIDIPTNLLEPMESVMIYLPTAVVAEYSLILPEDQTQYPYEKVCFDYPLILYSYVNSDSGYLTNVAHSCNEKFCTSYFCLCGMSLFSSGSDPWNIIPGFCPIASFFPDFLIVQNSTSNV